jgi:hypothetical protein
MPKRYWINGYDKIGEDHFKNKKQQVVTVYHQQSGTGRIKNRLNVYT